MCNVIKSMGCSRELTGKKLEGQQERLHCQHIHLHRNSYIRVKINQHTLPGSTIPRNMLPLLSLRIEPTCIWFAIDLEDGSSSVNAYMYHVITSVFEVGGMRVEVSQFI